jgi:ribosome-associated protein
MARISVTRSIGIDEEELLFAATRSGGAGGQHVNTTDSAVILRFDVAGSPNLPEAVKTRLAVLAGSRLTVEGVLILRSEGSRSQHENRREAVERLLALIRDATFVPKKRKATKATYSSKLKRLEGKTKRSGVKAGRGKVRID